MRFLGWLVCGLAIASCGAKTGLRIPDAGPPDVGHDTGTDAGFDAPPCEPERHLLTPATAELMLVIDRSASMRESITGDMAAPVDQWRWTILRLALGDALGSLDARVLVGAKFYPNVTGAGATVPEACSAESPNDVLPAPGTAPAIISMFTATDPTGGTPTAAALRIASGALSAGGPRRFMLLATDGAPNCNHDVVPQYPECVCTSGGDACNPATPRAPHEYSCLDDTHTIQTLDAILAQGVPTYVIGIEDLSRPEFSDVMDRMAVAGGRPRMVPGERAFYSVRSADQLHQALTDITSSISSCAFISPRLPLPSEPFAIAIDGTFVPEDPMNGWTWADRERGELDLHGEACDQARRGMQIECVIDACAP